MTIIRGICPHYQRRFIFAATGIFVMANVAILMLSVPTKSLVEADSLTLYRMATQWLSEGVFLEEQRQPLYPLLIATVFRVFGVDHFVALVVFQIGLLYLTGITIWLVSREWIPLAAHWVFALTILNPNALGNAHMPLADTVYAFLITLAVWGVVQFINTGQLRFAAAVGVLLGLGVLVRPETKFLIYILPLALSTMSLVSGRIRQTPLALVFGVFALGLAWMVAMPWAMHNQAAGYGLVLNSGEKAASNARGHFALVEAARLNRKQGEILRDLNKAEADLLEKEGLQPADASEIKGFLFGYYMKKIFASDPLIVARLYAKAWVAQFASGGAQTVNQVLGIGISGEDKLMNEGNWLSRFIDGLTGQSRAGTAITISCILFAVILRFVGLIGIVFMVLRRHWALLLIFAALVGFKAAIHLFYGISRYRLPVEPLLMVAAVYGFDGLRAALSRKY
jgi:4-amino-4-deoxy-L-arabinose transferase-like glycosyltransferase